MTQETAQQVGGVHIVSLLFSLPLVSVPADAFFGSLCPNNCLCPNNIVVSAQLYNRGVNTRPEVSSAQYHNHSVLARNICGQCKHSIRNFCSKNVLCVAVLHCLIFVNIASLNKFHMFNFGHGT